LSNPLTDALDTLGNITYVVVAIIIGIIIVMALASTYNQNQSSINESVVEVAKLCHIEQTIRDSIDQALIDSIPSDNWEQQKTKLILHKMMMGESIIDSEYQTVLDVLSVVQKKRLSVGDLEIGCNLVPHP